MNQDIRHYIAILALSAVSGLLVGVTAYAGGTALEDTTLPGQSLDAKSMMGCTQRSGSSQVM
jgi:hypothetical protein